MNKNERTQYVDVMKGFGILLVVLLHSIGYVRRGTPLPDVYSWRLEEWLHSFLMPYFVFVNGYIFNLFYVKKRLEGAAKIKNYFSRLLQIYLIFNSIMITVKMVFSKFTVDKIGGGAGG